MTQPPTMQRSVFSAIGGWSIRHRWVVIGVWALLVLSTLPILAGIEKPLKVGGFGSSNSESAEVARIMEQELHQPQSSLVIVYQSSTLQASDTKYQRQVSLSLLRLRHLPFVQSVLLPTTSTSMISRDGTTSYAIVGLDLGPEEAQREVPAAEMALATQPDVTYTVAGGPAFYADIETASQRDLRRAEVIAFPVAMVALLLVFGTVVAAFVPLLVGSAGVAVVLLIIYWLAHAVDVSIFALNLSTMLGLGLAVDYSLFITSRFREELRRDETDVEIAVHAAVTSAGRAVFFSALTVMIGLAGMIAFPLMFLRSIGIAGVVVVAVSSAAALTLLPAVLTVMGRHIERYPVVRPRNAVQDATHHGFWYVLSHQVMARPVIALLAGGTILALLGTPFLNANISSPTATILPRDWPSRQGFDLLAESFGEGEVSPFVIVLNSTTGTMQEPSSLNDLDSLTRRLEADPSIARVESAVNLPVIGAGLTPSQRVALRYRLEQQGTDTQLSRFLSPNTALILAFPVDAANTPRNREILSDLRSMPDIGDTHILIGGGTAEIVDVVDAIYSDFPLIALVIVIATYIVLLCVFRSVILPLKAILMNVLSVLASYGSLVWIFQEGHLHRYLGFDPQGFVEASLPVITFCILFGLSMDYEVFLLSRIQEEFLRSGNNRESVSIGMQRSGRIITSAALIVVVVTASFVTADVVLVKALGLGIAIAVAVDATIVRALLVPASMRLLGSLNWWCPRWLERVIPERFNLEH